MRCQRVPATSAMTAIRSWAKPAKTIAIESQMVIQSFIALPCNKAERNQQDHVEHDGADGHREHAAFGVERGCATATSPASTM